MPLDDVEQRAENSLAVSSEDPAARLLRSFEEESVDGNVPFPLFTGRSDPSAPEPVLDPVDHTVDPVDPLDHPLDHPVWLNHPVLYLADTEGGLS